MTQKLKYIVGILVVILFSDCKEKTSSQELLHEVISENVVFTNEKNSIKLAGTISLPKGSAMSPAVILISGNGDHNRNAEFGEHKPFLDISDYLAKNGIAVLRFDKRGVEQSEGNYGAASSFDFAEDVNAAINSLMSRSDIDLNHIGLIGHSEGGLIAPIVASMSSNVAFIISLAGPSLPGDQILLSQNKAIATVKGTDIDEIIKSQQLSKKAFDIVKTYTDDAILNEKMTNYVKEISKDDPDKPENMTMQEYVEAQVNGVLRPWMINFLRYNPEQYIKQVNCPVLALNGSKDLQVLANENLAQWNHILEEAGNKNVTTKVLKNLNHLFQTCETGLPDEYEKLEESFSPIVMKVMSDWIKKQVEL